MIETHSFSHNGGLENYYDAIYFGFSGYTALVILNCNNDKERHSRLSKIILKVLNNNIERYSFHEISNQISQMVKRDDEYMLVVVDDDRICVEQHGDVRGYLISNGDIYKLTNGEVCLSNEDRIVCGTGRFFKNLQEIAILADALTSISAEEWMDFLVYRISEKTDLIGDNLSAATLIVRKAETVKTI